VEEKVETDKVEIKDVVKIGCLIAKVLRDIKTNHVTTMIARFGKEILQTRPKRDGEKDKATSEK